MELLTKTAVRSLIEPREPPCISIYQPTHRHHPDNQQDPIRFKNLVRTVEDSLRQRYTGTHDLLAPLQALTANAPFWNHTLDGLAVLAAPGLFRVFQVRRPVKELAVVADGFHVKPLLRVVQSGDRYHVLCVTRHSARVFEGNRDALDELDPGTFPAEIEAALGDQRSEPHQTVASYGSGTGGAGPMFHGHGSRKDVVDKDTERYFRAVDRAMIAQFSKPSGLPLVLAALPEHQSVFRSLTQNAALLGLGVEGNPESMSAEQLRDASWRAVEPQYLQRLAELSEAFTTRMAYRRARHERPRERVRRRARGLGPPVRPSHGHGDSRPHPLGVGRRGGNACLPNASATARLAGTARAAAVEDQHRREQRQYRSSRRAAARPAAVESVSPVGLR